MVVVLGVLESDSWATIRLAVAQRGEASEDEGLTRDRVDLGTEHPQQVDLLLTLRLADDERNLSASDRRCARESDGRTHIRHVDDTLVALCAADVSETDAGIAGGTLDNGSSRLDAS